MLSRVPAGPRRPVADADGAAIASLITAFFIPPVAIILGVVAQNQAHRRDLRPSAVAVWGTLLGAVFTVGVIIAVIVVAANQPDATQQWINCINNAVSNGQDPNVVCPPSPGP